MKGFCRDFAPWPLQLFQCNSIQFCDSNNRRFPPLDKLILAWAYVNTEYASIHVCVNLPGSLMPARRNASRTTCSCITPLSSRTIWLTATRAAQWSKPPFPLPIRTYGPASEPESRVTVAREKPTSLPLTYTPTLQHTRLYNRYLCPRKRAFIVSSAILSCCALILR